METLIHDRLQLSVYRSDEPQSDTIVRSQHVWRISSTVQAKDSGNEVVEQSFTVKVSEFNDAPTDLSVEQYYDRENAGEYAEVATISAEDANGDPLTYSLVPGVGSTDNDYFVVDGDKLIAVSGFDFEAKSSYSVRLSASDGQASIEQSFAISVTDMNDQATATPSLNQIKGYTEGAAVVDLDNIVVSDADQGEILTATLTLSDSAVGTLTATSGNGETYNATTGVWTITNTVAKVNTALAGISFKPCLEQRP